MEAKPGSGSRQDTPERIEGLGGRTADLLRGSGTDHTKPDSSVRRSQQNVNAQ